MSQLKVLDIQSYVEQFIIRAKDNHHRYKSFDFCYQHFYPTINQGDIDIEKDCYVLWGFLASWGMLRGSSFLLQKNPAYLKPLIEFIRSQDKGIWEIDVHNYPDNYENIINLYKEVKQCIIKNNERDLVLVTKILLGVFGIIPAYDYYFCKTFKNLGKNDDKVKCSFNKFDESSLEFIHHFYLANRNQIDKLQSNLFVVDFDGNNSGLYYTKAKIIDMYGFNKSFNSPNK